MYLLGVGLRVSELDHQLPRSEERQALRSEFARGQLTPNQLPNSGALRRIQAFVGAITVLVWYSRFQLESNESARRQLFAHTPGD